MLPTQRCYKSLNNMTFKTNLEKMRLSGKPVYICSLETTGLDHYEDEVISIEIIECIFRGNNLRKEREYQFFCKPEHELSPEIEKISGITNKILESCAPIDDVMKDVYEILGDAPNIVGVNVADFCIPFFKNAGFNSGYMIDTSTYVDITLLAKAVFPLPNYKFKTICDALGLKEDAYKGPLSAKVNMKFDTFSMLFPLVTYGKEIASISNMSYWKKSYNCRFIYVYTNYGKVALNCKTLFWQECEDGLFDVVDLDALTKLIYNTYNVHNLYEFVKAFEAKQK